GAGGGGWGRRGGRPRGGAGRGGWGGAPGGRASGGSGAAAGRAPPLIERRLWFVLGKGGSGKSTVSATLGLTAALAGRRTLLMEVAGQNRVSAIFAGASVGHERPVELRPGLFGLSVMAEEAMEEDLTRPLGDGPPVRVPA